MGKGATVVVTLLVLFLWDGAEVVRDNFSSGKWFGLVVVPNSSSWLSDATLRRWERSAPDPPAVHASKSNFNSGETNILYAAYTLARHGKGWTVNPFVGSPGPDRSPRITPDHPGTPRYTPAQSTCPL